MSAAPMTGPAPDETRSPSFLETYFAHRIVYAWELPSVMRKQVESVAAAMKAFYEEARG